VDFCLVQGGEIWYAKLTKTPTFSCFHEFTILAELLPGNGGLDELPNILPKLVAFISHALNFR